MRLQKLDALRGIVLIGMIFYHMNYLMVEVFHRDILHLSEIFWYLLGRGVGIGFIFLAGISFFLATEKKWWREILKKSIKRFLILSVVAGGISWVSYMFFYEQRISWGIIHFFALASLCGICFLRWKSWNILVGILILAIGFSLSSLRVNSLLLIPIGLYPESYFSADYYPLFPWFGYYLIGYGFASFLGLKERLASLLSGTIIGGKWLAFVGRHSLFIYVIHVPILYLVFSLFFLQ